jgi:hypothetical protein
VERDHIGGGEQFVERQIGDAEFPLGFRVRTDRVEVDDVGGKGTGARGDFAPDPPQPDQTDRLAGNLERGGTERPLQPLAMAKGGIGFEESLVERKDQEEDVLGDTDTRAGRANGDGNPARPGRGEVDVVIADALVLDQAQPICPGKDGPGHRGGGDQEKIGRRGGGDDLIPLPPENEIEAFG